MNETDEEWGAPEPRLTIELVPATSWYSNVRSHVSKSEWDEIRKKVYRSANYRCEVCSGVGKKHPVECHEIWVYDDENYIQELAGMQALCPMCHKVKHFGRTAAIGEGTAAMNHISEVNKWHLPRVKKYIQSAFQQWEQRSLHEWSLNLTHLGGYINGTPK